MEKNIAAKICKFLNPMRVYDRSGIFLELKKFHPTLKESSFRWQLYNLQRDKRLQKIGRNKFKVANKADLRVEYSHTLSGSAESVRELVSTHFPNVKSLIWETFQFNEFVNHQLVRNIILVEVEHFCEECVFELIRNSQLGSSDDFSVLIKPDKKSLSTYQKETTIVVTTLPTESPADKRQKQQPSLEKILVDLFANKLISEVVSSSEYKNIFAVALERYIVDEVKMLRYARRRNKETLLSDFLREVRSEHND